MAPVFVAGTVRRIRSNTNQVFSRAASRLVATGGEGRLLVDTDDTESENFEQPAVDRPRRRRGRMLAPFLLFVFLLTSVDINRSAGSTNRWASQPEAAPRLQCRHSSGPAPNCPVVNNLLSASVSDRCSDRYGTSRAKYISDESHIQRL